MRRICAPEHGAQHAQALSIFAYGLICYAVFFATFLYALGFVGNFAVPSSIDGEPRMYSRPALLIDLALLGLFAVQHSLMARHTSSAGGRNSFPASAERSTYVLFSSVALIALFAWWQPIGGVVWEVADPAWRVVLYVAVRLRWGSVLFSSIPHQPLRPVRPAPDLAAVARPAVYGPAIRHAGTLQADPASAVLGWFFAFWATPDHDGDPPGLSLSRRPPTSSSPSSSRKRDLIDALVTITANTAPGCP
jgi:hypothetical protein